MWFVDFFVEIDAGAYETVGPFWGVRIFGIEFDGPLPRFGVTVIRRQEDPLALAGHRVIVERWPVLGVTVGIFVDREVGPIVEIIIHGSAEFRGTDVIVAICPATPAVSHAVLVHETLGVMSVGWTLIAIEIGWEIRRSIVGYDVDGTRGPRVAVTVPRLGNYGRWSLRWPFLGLIWILLVFVVVREGGTILTVVEGTILRRIVPGLDFYVRRDYGVGVLWLVVLVLPGKNTSHLS